jgi:hypothetical protein
MKYVRRGRSVGRGDDELQMVVRGAAPDPAPTDPDFRVHFLIEAALTNAGAR